MMKKFSSQAVKHKHWSYLVYQLGYLLLSSCAANILVLSYSLPVSLIPQLTFFPLNSDWSKYMWICRKSEV